MQAILSIDVSGDIAQAVAISLEGQEMHVVESHSAHLGTLFSKSTLVSADITALTKRKTSQPLLNGNSDHSAETQDESESQELQTLRLEFDTFSDLISKFQTPWTNAILVIPAYDYISLNIDLPFADNKSINKIIDLEIQDLVPFEVEDFLINHHPIGASRSSGSASSDKKFDVHVGMMPKQFIRQIVQICKACAFEPMVISTPSSILAGLYHLAPQFFDENSAIVFEHDPHYFVLTSLNGQVCTDRTLNRFSFATPNAQNYSGIGDPDKSLLTDLKLTLTAIERRYQKKFDKIYYVGQYFSASNLQQALGRRTEHLNIAEIVKTSDNENQLAALASVFVQDNEPPQVLSNFRTKEFAYSAQLKEIYRALKILSPYLIALTVSYVIYLILSYALTSFQISRLESSIRSQIEAALPEIKDAGADVDVLKALQSENQKLEDQLKDISSLSSLTPLDILLEVSKDLPESIGANITSIKIKDNKVVIDGSAKNYEDVANIKKILDKNPLYSDVKKGDSSGNAVAGGSRAFSFEIWLKE